MKFTAFNLTLICFTIFYGCSNQKTIEIPLTQKNGYGYFHPALGGISPYSEDENNPWIKTYLTVRGAPKNWTDIKYGDIETNIYQSIYQNYFLGNITQERYEELQKSWAWKPDTLALSKKPLKTKIAFAFGKDSTGIMKMIVDANNNLDLSDDVAFVPIEINYANDANIDSLANFNSIIVSYEKYVENKKELATAPLFIVHMSRIDMFMYNFPQYSIANFNGKKIAVCSDNFINLSYKNPSIMLINGSLKDDDKISPEKLSAKNEFIEIKGVLYKNIGINRNANTLVLEKIILTKSELYSTKIGFKSPAFWGKDFMTGSYISSKNLKGKYVLLDFWAVWCGPCLQEFPHMKKLYDKTDREKFEIIGIVGDSPSDGLKSIIEKNSISWTQILSTDSNNIKETYGIHGYPTTFLINPEGIIVAKDLRGKELEEKINEFLNE